MPFDLLCETIYSYTCNILETMTEQGTAPMVVQVGNEITNGFLWAAEGQDGNCGGQLFFEENNEKQWPVFVKLINRAISAVRKACNSAKVMLQIDKGAFPEAAVWWFDKARAYGIDFDIIGLSYYFLWHHATVDELTRLSCLSITFPEKDIMLAETSYPYRDAEGIHMQPTDNNPPFTRQGQASYVHELLTAMRKMPNGCGICWWGAFFLNNTFDRCEDLFCAQALFDGNGAALEALSAFKGADGDL
jgi:arabinogalactan endo-1,4-beta-galactosidase